MKYKLIENPTKNTECLIIGVFADVKSEDLNLLAKDYINILNKLYPNLKELGDIVMAFDNNGINLCLVHCGIKAEFNRKNLRKCLEKIATNILLKTYSKTATIFLPAIIEHNAEWQLQQMILQLDKHFYQLLDFKTKDIKKLSLENIQFYLPEATSDIVDKSSVITAAVNYTRYLADLPGNICTPYYLGNTATKLANEHPNLEAKIFTLNEIKKFRMGGLLAVSQGSAEPPCFIELQYTGAKDAQPIVLVGKGITFDSGGLSLKPPQVMDEMKYDMAGAATVLGVIKACASLNLPVNVIGLVASAENLPSGTAIKPGDIITTMSGQTVEILNTDAEGRLILADALTYAEKFNPSFVIDLATLTGAVIVALGHVNTGFMTQDEELANKLMQAAQKTDERIWRLPLEDEYQEALKSPLADMINASFDRTASSVVAACFLSRFTSKYRWAHLDIAGTAWVSGKNRHATGHPLTLLVQLIQDLI